MNVVWPSGLADNVDRYKALKSCSNMQWYECWHSEGVAPQFTKPPFFLLEETGGYCYIIGMLNSMHINAVNIRWGHFLLA